MKTITLTDDEYSRVLEVLMDMIFYFVNDPVGLVIFTVAKTIENKHDLDDMYTEPVSWWAALFYTLAPVWILALALLAVVVFIFAFCGVCNFIIYMGDSL